MISARNAAKMFLNLKLSFLSYYNGMHHDDIYGIYLADGDVNVMTGYHLLASNIAF